MPHNADALRRAAAAPGCDPRKTVVVSNGADPERFPADRARARHTIRLSLNRKIILSVGHLLDRKSFHPIPEAIHRLRAKGIHDSEYVIEWFYDEVQMIKQSQIAGFKDLALAKFRERRIPDASKFKQRTSSR